MTGFKRNPLIDAQETGKKIKRIMEERGYTVADVQEYLGLITPQSIYHWFRGRNLPTIDNLYALSDLFQVPIDDMVCGNRKMYSVAARKDSSQIIVIYYEKLNRLAA